MEEINFKEFISYLLQKIWLAAAILLVVFAGGEIYTTFLKTPLYASTSNVVLISDSNKSEITYNDVTLSNNLVKTYSEIVKSRNVLNKVIANLNLKETYESLSGKVSVSSVTSTQLISIRVNTKNASDSEKITNEIARVFKSEIKTIYGIDNVQIVDKAVAASSPYNINVVKESLIYLAAGLMLGLGATMLLYVLDKTIKDTETIEDKLGLTVIGVVPSLEAK